VGFETFGLDPGDLELEVVGERAVDEGLLEGFVAVLVLDVLADDGDGDFILRVVGAADDLLPAGEVGGLASMRRCSRTRASTPSVAKLRGSS
jgi:hypothetical protein